MDGPLIASLVLCGLVGALLGVFGGGGSILTVPLLVYVARLAPAQAIGMSLAVVGVTSAVAALAHHRRGTVKGRMGLLYGASSAITAFLGGRLTHLVSGDVLMLLFATLMVVVGFFMLGGKGAADRAQASSSQ